MRRVTAPVMSSAETLGHMLDKAQRRLGTPLRRSFAQRGTRHDPKPGALAKFIANRDGTGLDLFLLMLTLATKEPYHVIYPSAWWQRALELSDETIVSRAWKRLQERRLIARERDGRLVVVTPLMEDGTLAPYTRPAAKGESYGKLPQAYWREGHFKTLPLPGKAMLIISIVQHGSFTLPLERVKDWYGISADTAEIGFRALRDAGILTRQPTWTLSRRAPDGYAQTYIYKLRAPYSSGKEVELRVLVS
jgi:hypothetical protein